jgi:antitoxin component of MazEF toxin-antitoxin module
VKDLPHEEIRKIIRIGDSYAVTMPRAWIRFNKLRGKDEVLVVSDGSVVIHPPERKSE